MRLWQRHLVDICKHFETDDDIVGEAGRIAWLESLPQSIVTELKGVKVAAAQWMSLSHAGGSWDELLASRALVMLNACMHKAWLVTAEDAFTPIRVDLLRR